MLSFTVFFYGRRFLIKKVETGGYTVLCDKGFSSRYVEKHIYYRVTYDGKRVDSRLTYSGALRAAKKEGKRLLKQEVGINV